MSQKIITPKIKNWLYDYSPIIVSIFFTVTALKNSIFLSTNAINNLVIFSIATIAGIIAYQGLVFSLLNNERFKKILGAENHRKRFIRYMKSPMFTSIAIVVTSFIINPESRCNIVLSYYLFMASLLSCQFIRFLLIFNFIFDPKIEKKR